jgi:hypothetical protein
MRINRFDFIQILLRVVKTLDSFVHSFLLCQRACKVSIADEPTDRQPCRARRHVSATINGAPELVSKACRQSNVMESNSE